MLEKCSRSVERPEDLSVYAAAREGCKGTGVLLRIVESLRHLARTRRSSCSSGKPVAVFPSSPDAPPCRDGLWQCRLHYATAEYFDELCDRGADHVGASRRSTGQYIEIPGRLQGVYELRAGGRQGSNFGVAQPLARLSAGLAEWARRNRWPSANGTWSVTSWSRSTQKVLRGV